MAVTTLQPNVFEFISLLTADPTLNLILAVRRPGSQPALNSPVQQSIAPEHSLLIVGKPTTCAASPTCASARPAGEARSGGAGRKEAQRA
jgi:hypothetical protein